MRRTCRSIQPSVKRRRVRGRSRAGAAFPLPPAKSKLPDDYAVLLNAIKQRVQREHVQIVRAANSSMILLYWEIGGMILKRQRREGWGAKVIERLGADLRSAFPDMNGFSTRNLLSMRNFAETYRNSAIVKQTVSQLPWGHVLRLLQLVKYAPTRLWYMRACIREGWARATLEKQVRARAHLRHGKAVNNFVATLPATSSDAASQVFKDPYLFDFLGTADPRREREVEQALVDHIQRFLLEMGSGFAFVGRQVHLEVEGNDYYIDLLFYHLKLRCYVVVELKAGPFEPSFVGQLNLYLSAADDLLRHPDDKPTIGLLLCRSKSRLVVEYALRGFAKPIGVAGWEDSLVAHLPKELKGSLPTVEQIEAELEAVAAA